MVQLYSRFGGESVVNSITAGIQSQPSMARLASGAFVIVWVSETTPLSGNWEIRGQLYDSAGARQGGEFLASPSTGLRGEPRVAALSSGGFVVTWSYDVHDGTGSQAGNLQALRVRGQIFDSAATKVGGELTIGTDTTGDHIDSQVVGLAGGGFAVTWSRLSPGADALGQVFDPAGAATGAQLILSSATAGSQINTAAAALPGGGFIAAWTDTASAGVGDPTSAGVKAQFFDSAGAKVGSEFLVNTTTAGAQSAPNIALLDSGGFVMTWADTSHIGADTSGQATKGQIFNSAGAKVGGEFLVNTHTEGDQFISSVSALPGGGFVAAWRDGPQDDADIKAQVFDSAGGKVGIEFVVNSLVAGHQNTPVILGLASGGFAAAWVDQGTGDGDQAGVKTQVFALGSGAPTDIELSSYALNENAVENVAVATLSAEGAANSGFTYQILADSSGGAFRIEGDKLVVDDNAKLDFETAPQLTVTIRATDANGQSYDEAIVLDVTDIGHEKRYSAGDEYIANTHQAGQEFGATVVPLELGGYGLIWLEYDPGTAGSPDPAPERTVLRLYDSSGAPVSGEITIADKWVQGMAVTPLDGGGFLIVREAYHEPANTFSIKAQAYNGAGSPVGPEIVLGSSTSGFPHSPSVAKLATGGFVIAWATPANEVHAQSFSPSGSPAGPEITITASYDSLPVSLAPTAAGGFAASWIEIGATPQDPEVAKVQFYDENGDPAGAPISVELGDDAGSLTILALADGSYMLAWVEVAGSQDGINLELVVAQPIASDFFPVGDPVVLTAFLREPDTAEIRFAVHPDGGFVVTWPMIDVSTGAITYTVEGQLFDYCGCPIGSPFQPTGFGGNYGVGILLDGTIVASWTGPDSADSGVYARVFRPADEPIEIDGDDVLYGDENPNILDGGDGDDQLYGLGEDDDLIGGPGNDILDGGPGADAMAGGTGNDAYYVDQAGDAVTENAGEGTDEIRTGLATFSLAGLPNVENLTGTSNSGQSLTGNGAANIVNAGSGNDFVFLQAGGNDYALGNEGNDVFLFGGTLTSMDQVEGGDGVDQIVLQGNYAGGTLPILGANVSGIENLAILPGNDTRFGDPGTNFYDYNITITDSVLGEGVQLVIDANRLRAGEDLTVDGSTETDGSFFIYGGNGVDTLTGGANKDVFIFGGQGQWGSGDVVTGGAGVDQLALRGNYTIVFGANQLVGIEQIGMVSAQDTRYGALGSSYSYDLTMVDANVDGIQFTVDAAPLRPGETLTFNGSAEDDGSFRVFGGRGNDTIVGSQNGDIIAGNAGADMLTGGGGGDAFRYVATSDSTTGAVDRILDFLPGTDWIDLSRIDADTNADGNQAFHWIGSNAFGTSGTPAGELRAYQAGNSWFIEGDTNGDGAADLIIEVVGPAPLGADNFVL